MSLGKKNWPQLRFWQKSQPVASLVALALSLVAVALAIILPSFYSSPQRDHLVSLQQATKNDPAIIPLEINQPTGWSSEEISFADLNDFRWGIKESQKLLQETVDFKKINIDWTFWPNNEALDEN